MRLIKIEPTSGNVRLRQGMDHTRRESGPLWLHHDEGRMTGRLTLEDNRDRSPGEHHGSMTPVRTLAVRWGGEKHAYAAVPAQAADRYAADPNFHAIMSDYHFGQQP